MICKAITRQGYINIMKGTDYGYKIDSPIYCPSHVVAKLEKFEIKDCSDCIACWEGILNKVKFKGDV